MDIINLKYNSVNRQRSLLLWLGWCLSISSLSLLPALFNSLRSCLNNLISAMSVFNPAPLTAVNSAMKTLQLQRSIYLKVPNFTLVPLLRAGFGFWGVCEIEKRHNGGSGAAGHLHADPCVAGHGLPKYYTAISELRKKVKLGKTKMLPGLCSSTAVAIKRLVFSHLKSTNPVFGKASQEHALHLLGWILDDDISKFKMSAIKKKKKKEHSL